MIGHTLKEYDIISRNRENVEDKDHNSISANMCSRSGQEMDRKIKIPGSIKILDVQKIVLLAIAHT